MTYELQNLNKKYQPQSPERRAVQKPGFPYSDQKAGSKTEKTKSIVQQVYDRTWFLQLNKNESEKSQEHWNLWLKEFQEVKKNIRELELIHDGFQTNFGGEKTLSGSFKPAQDYRSFIKSYNEQLDECAKKVPLLNAPVDEYNKNLPQGELKVEKLPLPPKLEFLESASKSGNEHSHKSYTGVELSEGQDLVVKTSDSKLTESYWNSVPNFNRQCKLVVLTGGDKLGEEKRTPPEKEVLA